MPTHFIFERLQLVLDSSGHVLKYQLHNPQLASDDAFKHWQGQSLAAVLGGIHAHWADQLPATWVHNPHSLFLSAPEHPLLPYGMMLDGIAMGDCIYAVLVPSLASSQALHQVSVMDLPASGPTAAQLFLRLQIAENRLNSYLENFPGIFFSQRPDLSFGYVSTGFEALFGRCSNTLKKSSGAFLQWMIEEDRAHFLREIARSTREKMPVSLRYRLQLSSGKWLHVLDVRTPQIAPNGLLLGYEGVWLDITRQVVAEERLSQSSWKDSLAVLSGGLLHDFSNMMAGIHSISELYASTLEADHAWKVGLGQIQKSTQEAQGIVRRILDLQRNVESKKGYFDLKQLIQGQSDLLKIILPKGSTIEYNLSDQELPVYLDDVRFRQTLLNLAMNTRDALAGQPGRVCIHLEAIEAGAPLSPALGGSKLSPRLGSLLKFQDEAGGISQEHLDNIFDPFFTTKEATKGSGLGLYNAKLFVESLGGYMGVESVVGEGSIFHIYLPCTDFTEQSESVSSDTPVASRRRIALYSQEDLSNFDLVDHLRENNWEVMSCRSHNELMVHLREAPKKPHLVLLIELGHDPEFEPLVESLRQEHPKLRLTAQLLNPTISARPKLHALLDRVIPRETATHKILEGLNALADKWGDN